GPHATFQCQPRNQKINSSGFDQIQPSQYPVIHHPSQEMSEKILRAKENLMKSIQTFLKKFNRISFREMPKVLLRAWEKFFKIRHAQPEDTHELFRNHLEDLQIINTLIDSSPKFDYLLEEFSGELAHIDLIPLGIEEADFDLEEEIQFIFENYDAAIESFSPSPIPVENSDSLMEEIDFSLTPDDSMPPGIENDDYESEWDILIHEELLSNNSLSLHENESFHFNIPSSPRPPAKPLDDDEIKLNLGILTVKVVGDISEQILSSSLYFLSFNWESYTLIDSSPKFDYLLEEFSGELAHIDLIPLGIEEADFDLEEEIRLVENLLYDNLSLRPPKELNAKIAYMIVESLSPSPIPVEDSDSQIEEIDLFLDTDDLMPPGSENDDYDSEGDIHILEELLSNDTPPLPKNESSKFDHHDDPSFSCPPLEPPDVEIFFDFKPD
nr:hypothetical protein [Tanacetum cinerariifolium]